MQPSDTPLQQSISSSHKQQQQQPQQPKALRFVTNYGAPHPKRRRIGAACLTCRKRKTACSGERPFCETCKQNKLDCTGYSAETANATVHTRTTSESDVKPSLEQGEIRRKSPPAPIPDQKGEVELSRTIARSRSAGSASGSTKPAEAAKDDSRPQNPLFAGPRNRMPYFRWLGPTAIMPGFKQMVVKIKRQDTDVARSSTDGGVRSPSLSHTQSNDPRAPSVYSATPAATEADIRTPVNLPFYDTSPVPPSELITHLANMFFTHVGCNYPFLQKERFMRDLEEKQVDAILVDAVCAIAARFSTHPLLTQDFHYGEKSNPAEYGHAFAQRAKTALPDTYACPSVAAAQAALLLAYIEFGEQRDSGLWMYLGISIRLAQDLGLHKLEGLRYLGKEGPTPKMVKRESRHANASKTASSNGDASSDNKSSRRNEAQKELTPEEQSEIEETKAVEQERMDTFWAIFFLDRVVSSGTGRRSTLRDKDIELSFPSAAQAADTSDWPAPFPALIRIIHLYGRVADLLNSIKESSDVTSDTSKRLASMERQVTSFYQGLSSKLHFDAVNFQHYMKAGQGTNFVLLHFWFHTLIVLLHQPTLFKTFEGKMLQLFPNSQQLSMSSAKTIADILSYSQLMDAKAPLGNPFTSQPIYIAACAFLKETVDQTATSGAQSCASTPRSGKENNSEAISAASSDETSVHAPRRSSISASVSGDVPTTKSTPTSAVEQKSQLAKHTLLATAATQHYQLCYKALQSLETYWAGAKYILTVLNQKFEGVGDPLLYTVEEGECSMEQPRPEPAFTSPGWRRKFSWGTYAPNQNNAEIQMPFWPGKGFGQIPEGPRAGDANKTQPPGSIENSRIGAPENPYTAIGWTLTGNMDSTSANFAWHYASGNTNHPNSDSRFGSMNPPDYDRGTGQGSYYSNHLQPGLTGSQRFTAQDGPSGRSMLSYDSTGIAATNAENPSALNVSKPYSQQGNTQAPIAPAPATFAPQHNIHGHMSAPATEASMHGNMIQAYSSHPFMGAQGGQVPMHFMPEDMMIETQDVDMSMLLGNGSEVMPWFDSYPTPEMMGLYDPNGHNAVNGNSSARSTQHGQQH